MYHDGTAHDVVVLELVAVTPKVPNATEAWREMGDDLKLFLGHTKFVRSFNVWSSNPLAAQTQT